MSNLIKVHFLHHTTDDVITLEFPRDTVIDTLTGYLYEKGFIEPQKPGYRYLIQDHLCGNKHTLANYLPDDADELTIKVFHIPTIMTGSVQ